MIFVAKSNFYSKENISDIDRTFKNIFFNTVFVDYSSFRDQLSIATLTLSSSISIRFHLFFPAPAPASPTAPAYFILQHPISSYWIWNNGQIRCSRFLNNHINLPNMIRSFANGTIVFLVVKNWTEKYYNTMDMIITCRQILVFEVSKQFSWYKYSYQLAG